MWDPVVLASLSFCTINLQISGRLSLLHIQLPIPCRKVDYQELLKDNSVGKDMFYPSHCSVWSIRFFFSLFFCFSLSLHCFVSQNPILRRGELISASASPACIFKELDHSVAPHPVSAISLCASSTTRKMIVLLCMSEVILIFVYGILTHDN